MASFLKDLTVALGLLTSDQTPIADQYGWKDYVWRVRPLEQCIRQSGFCAVVGERWDWKREQYYSFDIALNPTSNTVDIRLGLDNRDPSDRDNVCVVALFMDAQDREQAIFYQNWVSYPMKSYRRSTPLRLPVSRPVGALAKVAVGVKQCEEKNAQDARLFYLMRTMLEQR